MDAPTHSVSSILSNEIQAWPGRIINVRRCGELYMVFLELKDPLELLVFVDRREFLPSSGFLSRRDMTFAVESDVKPQILSSFLPR